MGKAAVRPLASRALLKPLARIRLVLCWRFRQRNERHCAAQRGIAHLDFSGEFYEVCLTWTKISRFIQGPGAPLPRVDYTIGTYKNSKGAGGDILRASGGFGSVSTKSEQYKCQERPFCVTRKCGKTSARHGHSPGPDQKPTALPDRTLPLAKNAMDTGCQSFVPRAYGRWA